MSRGTLDPAGLPGTSDTGLSPSAAGCPKAVLLSLADPFMQSEPRHARMPVWADPRSLAATGGIDVSFSSSGYLDVSVPRVPLHMLWIHIWMAEVFSAGFPHSEISGSMGMCPSPELFAAYHVFHRLPVPRHPPCALLCLTFLHVLMSVRVCQDGIYILLSSPAGIRTVHSSNHASSYALLRSHMTTIIPCLPLP